MSGLSIGLSGMSVNQQLLNLVGQNIANASNPGYHRQVGLLAAVNYGADIGSGVTLEGVQRQIDTSVEAGLLTNNSDTSATTQQLSGLTQIQSYLAPNSGSLADLVQNFYSQAQQLSSQPDDVTQRQVVLAAAGAVTSELNSISGNFTQMGRDLTNTGQQMVQEVNTLTGQIAQLNDAIRAATVKGTAPNDLLDQRDQLISQLSQDTDVRTVSQPLGEVNVLIGGVPAVAGNQSTPLTLGFDSNNQLALKVQGSTSTIGVTGGKLGGILALYNQDLPAYQSQVNTFASTFASALDGVQATGIGLAGPLTTLTSTRPVSYTHAPLGSANLGFPVQSGPLYVSVTDQATGQVTTSRIDIDPTTESLHDVASAISGIPNLQAVVNDSAGTMTILAKPGYAFDFAGRPSTTPDTAAITGTMAPQVSGVYTGTANNAFTFKVVGSGTVGATPGLALQVTNTAGSVVSTLNIGQGYQVGSPLTVQGLQVTLPAGTANAGDGFTVQAIAQPDASGILTGLGLNTFFTGTSAADLQVQPGLLKDATGLALSGTGAPGDGTNLARLVATQDQTLMNGGSQTFNQYLGGIIGTVGGQVQHLTDQQTAQQAVGGQLSAQQQSASGVDPNQELTTMLQYQLGFQMSARYITAINQTFTDLLNIIP